MIDGGLHELALLREIIIDLSRFGAEATNGLHLVADFQRSKNLFPVQEALKVCRHHRRIW